MKFGYRKLRTSPERERNKNGPNDCNKGRNRKPQARQQKCRREEEKDAMVDSFRRDGREVTGCGAGSDVAVSVAAFRREL